MTEYEFTEVLSSLYAQVTTDSTTVFSLVTAYLIAAYLIGAKLPKVQLYIVNVLFGGWALMAIFAVGATMDKAAWITQRLIDSGYELNEITGVSAAGFFSIAFPALLLASMLAAYYFMWSVRHPKAE